MKVKTEAIVLHSFKYGESKMIVDTFTRTHGRLSFAVPLPRSAHSKLKKQYFQPLTLLNIEADIQQQSQLQKISEASIAAPLPSLLSDPSKLAIALFICEFLYHALRDEQQNEPLFEYVCTSIQWLDQRESDFANFHLVFLMHLSRFLGFYPNLDIRGCEDSSRYEVRGARYEDRLDRGYGGTEVRGCEDSSRYEVRGARYEDSLYFDLRAAEFCSLTPTHRDFLMPQEAGRIRLLMRMDYATMHLFRMGRADRNRILEIIIHYYRLHIPQFPELRSLPVLQELFQ